jgi:hypothetical protein
LNLTGYSTATLTFKHAYEQNVRKDSLIIRVSVDCGTTWQRVWGMGPDGTPTVFVTHPSTGNSFYPQSADDWCGGSYGTGCYTIDLSPWAGNSSVKLMFEAYNRYGNNLFLNDIQVSGPVGNVEINSSKPFVRLYPNPSQGLFHLSITNCDEDFNLVVMNPQGQAIYTDNLVSRDGNISRQMDFSHLSKGIYFLRLTGKQASWVEKLVVN